MRIIIAPDSYKNALRNTDVAQALADGWRGVRPEDELLLFPMSDGGEGFCASLLAANPDWKTEKAVVHDALMRPLEAQVLVSGDGTRGALELAAASGLELIKNAELRPLEATTFGTGELLDRLLALNCRKIWMGIGGSATTDGGAGLLMALGAVFHDHEGRRLDTPPGGGMLHTIAQVDLSPVLKKLAGVELTVACDVTNPLCGLAGAAHVFSPQKGASPDEVAILDRNLRHWTDCLKRTGDFPGAGAAGGVGFASACIGGRLLPGGEVLITASGLEAAMACGAELVITGEGKSDAQTLDGKLCFAIARAAARHHIPVALLSGAIPPKDRPALAAEFAHLVAISDDEPNLESALAHTKQNLTAAAARLACGATRLCLP